MTQNGWEMDGALTGVTELNVDGTEVIVTKRTGRKSRKKRLTILATAEMTNHRHHTCMSHLLPR